MRGLDYELPRYQPKRRCASTARPAPTLPHKSPSMRRAIGKIAAMRSRSMGTPLAPPVKNIVSTASLRDLRVNVDFFRKHISNTGITPQEIQIGSAQFTVTNNNATKTGPSPLVDYKDHWWNPQESGMGFSIMQHPSDRIFAAWFVYDQMGQPTWYTLQPGQWLSSTVYTGPIYKTTGTYLGATYDPGQLVVTPVGTGTLSFHSYSSATFTYTVEGKNGTKEITRLSF